MRLSRTGAAVVAVLLALGITTPAQAAQTRTKVERGVDGCFAWSWDRDWTVYATVYYHNRCSYQTRIKIAWKWSGYEAFVEAVPADGKGHVNRMSDPVSIWDAGVA